MIDWSFIGSLEGRRLAGYVPRDASGAPLGRSGVTIATGCDLGYVGPRDLARFPLPFRFQPYVGIFGEIAAAFVAAHPVTICGADADAIDRIMFADDTASLQAAYDRDAGGQLFFNLPGAAETVIASLAFQYGSLRRKCPHFWACAIRRDWASMVHELLNFGDAYPTRRHKEADYLSVLLA